MLPVRRLVFALLASLPATAALASPHDGHRAEEQKAIASAAIDATAAIAAVRAAGYGTIREVEWEHGRWEVQAIDAEGRPAFLAVDATSGTVTRRGH